jgi:hypothetical protein
MSNLSDVVGGANLFGGSSYSFVPDKFCSSNSAIYFKLGYLQVPAGVYFSGDFTVTAWIYLKFYQYDAQIFDFGNGQTSDNVLLGMFGTTSKIHGFTFIGLSSKLIKTSPIVNLNQWYFISFVLKDTTGYIYVNGSQAITGTLYVPNNITRISNYIGIKNNLTSAKSNAIYDELKIYKGALSSDEIMNEYQISSNKGKLNLVYFFYYSNIFNLKVIS